MRFGFGPIEPTPFACGNPCRRRAPDWLAGWTAELSKPPTGQIPRIEAVSIYLPWRVTCAMARTVCWALSLTLCSLLCACSGAYRHVRHRHGFFAESNQQPSRRIRHKMSRKIARMNKNPRPQQQFEFVYFRQPPFLSATPISRILYKKDCIDRNRRKEDVKLQTMTR